MFSLAIYDTLTPGSLTDDEIVAGTGEIAPDGRVGPIGGIQQKVVAARDSGAELFMVPEANCEEALEADNGDMQLVLAETMHSARLAIEDVGRRPRRRPAQLRGRGGLVMDPIRDLDSDPALAAAVLEIESHLADGGWDQPARLYALVDTAQLVRREPALAAAMGLDASSERGSLTAVEQDQIDPNLPLEQVLESIAWPDDVAGCAAVVERLVLPPAADQAIPEDPERAQQFALEHPDRQEVRIVAGATRHGATYCALRLRAHDDDQSVVGGIDLVPGLLALLGATLSDDEEREQEKP